MRRINRLEGVGGSGLAGNLHPGIGARIIFLPLIVHGIHARSGHLEDRILIVEDPSVLGLGSDRGFELHILEIDEPIVHIAYQVSMGDLDPVSLAGKELHHRSCSDGTQFCAIGRSLLPDGSRRIGAMLYDLDIRSAGKSGNDPQNHILIVELLFRVTAGLDLYGQRADFRESGYIGRPGLPVVRGIFDGTTLAIHEICFHIMGLPIIQESAALSMDFDQRHIGAAAALAIGPGGDRNMLEIDIARENAVGDLKPVAFLADKAAYIPGVKLAKLIAVGSGADIYRRFGDGTVGDDLDGASHRSVAYHLEDDCIFGLPDSIVLNSARVHDERTGIRDRGGILGPSRFLEDRVV